MSETLVILCASLAVGVGFSGGVVFTFSNFALRALGSLKVEDGARAMQRLNAAVYNPVFMGGLFGTALLSLVTAVFAFMESGWASAMAGAGSITFLVAVFAVTAARNVPLNHELDRVRAESDEMPELWLRYQRTWGRWNRVRTLASFASIVALVGALGVTVAAAV